MNPHLPAVLQPNPTPVVERLEAARARDSLAVQPRGSSKVTVKNQESIHPQAHSPTHVLYTHARPHIALRHTTVKYGKVVLLKNGGRCALLKNGGWVASRQEAAGARYRRCVGPRDRVPTGVWRKRHCVEGREDVVIEGIPWVWCARIEGKRF